MSFWHKLPKPIIVLAPLANVTDAAFRRVIAKYSEHVRKDGTLGGPDVFWTEFVSADGLIRATPEGKKKLMDDLIFTDAERPIVAQLFSSHPEYMEQAARLCVELGFDGIDINMGCPDRTIEKQGAGAALIKNPECAREVLRAAKRGAGDVPVSVKTRIGYNKNELATWIPALLSEKPAVLTLHARTRKELSKVPARWEHVREVVELRDTLQKNEDTKTLIFGNGDVTSLEMAHAKATETGADGVMIGRGIFGNPWFFSPEGAPNALDARLAVLVEHTRLYEELLPQQNFALMKKHYKSYVAGFEGAHDLRMELMNAENALGVETVVNRFLGR